MEKLPFTSYPHFNYVDRGSGEVATSMHETSPIPYTTSVSGLADPYVTVGSDVSDGPTWIRTKK